MFYEEQRSWKKATHNKRIYYRKSNFISLITSRFLCFQQHDRWSMIRFLISEWLWLYLLLRLQDTNPLFSFPSPCSSLGLFHGKRNFSCSPERNPAILGEHVTALSCSPENSPFFPFSLGLVAQCLPSLQSPARFSCLQQTDGAETWRILQVVHNLWSSCAGRRFVSLRCDTAASLSVVSLVDGGGHEPELQVFISDQSMNEKATHACLGFLFLHEISRAFHVAPSNCLHS